MTIEEKSSNRDNSPESKSASPLERALSYSPNLRPELTQTTSQFDITKSIGTPTYSSPEQLHGKAEGYNHKSDIFSLALVILQLFWPMNTVMEQMKVLAKAREGTMPEKFMDAHPELVKVLKAMLLTEPKERPELPEIHDLLLAGEEFGLFQVQQEGSKKWKTKVLKLHDKKLFCIPETQTKADWVYTLQDCSVAVTEDGTVRVDSSMQLGLLIKTNSSVQKSKVYNALHRFAKV
jgi:serine/threonine protein kinase